MKTLNLFVIQMTILSVLANNNPIFLNETFKADFIKIKENNSEIFYLLFESRSEPSTDPLIFWLNGDLGFSSLISAFLENGPLKLQDDLSLAVNPFSWSNNANLVFVDMIVGTGFSQGNDGNQTPKNIFDVVNDFYEFLEGFFELDENYRGRKIYLSGFSFSGHWIPAIAENILSKNNSNINLAGISIGNGIFDAYMQFSESIFFAYQNNLIDEQEYELKKDFFSDCLEKIKEEGSYEETNEICKKSFEEFIFSDDGKTRFNTHDIRKQPSSQDSEDEDDVEKLERFLNKPEVIQEMFGNSDKNKRKWVQFSPLSVELLIRDLFINSTRSIQNILQNDVSVLVYNGDQDFNYNWIGSEKWANELEWHGLGEKQFKEVGYQKWQSFGEYKSVGNFVFLKVFQAGHFVLEDQPEASMIMIDAFISGQFADQV